MHINPKPDVLKRTPPSSSLSGAPWRLETHAVEPANTPSPGEYVLPGAVGNKNVESKFKSQGGFSMTGRDSSDIKRPLTPGPGDYNANRHYRNNNSRVAGFGWNPGDARRPRDDASDQPQQWAEEAIVDLPPSVGPQVSNHASALPNAHTLTHARSQVFIYDRNQRVHNHARSHECKHARIPSSFKTLGI